MKFTHFDVLKQARVIIRRARTSRQVTDSCPSDNHGWCPYCAIGKAKNYLDDKFDVAFPASFFGIESSDLPLIRARNTLNKRIDPNTAYFTKRSALKILRECSSR